MYITACVVLWSMTKGTHYVDRLYYMKRTEESQECNLVAMEIKMLDTSVPYPCK